MPVIIDVLQKSTRWSANYDFYAFRYACTPCTLRFVTLKTLFSTNLKKFATGLMLCQRYIKRSGAAGETRTPDLMITNQLLYQLSYDGKNKK